MFIGDNYRDNSVAWTETMFFKVFSGVARRLGIMNKAQVEQLLSQGRLLAFAGSPSPDWVLVEDLERAMHLATSQDVPVDWTRVREWLFRRQGGFSEEEVHERLLAALPHRYLELDNEVNVDLQELSSGPRHPLAVPLWQAYAAGGFPCGWEGPEWGGPDRGFPVGRLCVFWDPRALTPEPEAHSAAMRRRLFQAERARRRLGWAD